VRCSVHIDVGYLYAALATLATGSANRAAINVDVPGLVKDLIDLATQDSGLRLLRVLWYDAAQDGLPDQFQRRIGLIDSVKLRMGRINPFGEQKGVDLRLGLDLVSLGVNRAVEVAYLVSGDDDLTEAVTDAQDLGLQIKLVTVPGSADGRPMAVAANLSLAVDGVMTIPDAVIAKNVSRATRAPRAPEPSPPTQPTIPAPTPGATQSRPTPGSVPVIPPGPRPTVNPQTPPPRPAVVPPAPSPAPVYTSATGSSTNTGTAVIGQDLIDQVARSVFEVWATTATPEDLTLLKASRPNVPSQIDRILLADLVNLSGVYDIPSYARFGLRDAFWTVVTASPGPSPSSATESATSQA